MTSIGCIGFSHVHMLVLDRGIPLETELPHHVMHGAVNMVPSCHLPDASDDLSLTSERLPRT